MYQDRLHNMFWSTVWDCLPDPQSPKTPHGPLTKIRITVDFWRHIEKHLHNEERQWSELLGSSLRRKVIQAVGQEDIRSWFDVFKEASDILERQCRTALWRPLLIRFSHRDEWQLDWNQRWLLILPIGAIAIVRLTKSQYGGEWKLITTFFDRVGRGSMSDRWRAAARKQYDRYRLQMPDYIAPPSDNTEYRIPQANKSREVHRTVRLVSPEQWGVFDDHGIAKWELKLKEWPSPSQQSLSFPDNLERYL